MNPSLKVIEKNIQLWKTSKLIFQKYKEKGMTQMEILLKPNFEEEVFSKFNNKTF